MFKLFRSKEFTRLILLMKPKSFEYFAGIIGKSVTDTIFQLSIAFVLKLMMNAAEKKEILYLIQAAILFISVSILSSFLQMFFSYLYNRCVRIAIAGIRIRLFEQIELIPIEYFEKNHSGDIVSTITNDVQTLENVFSTLIYNVIYTSMFGISAATAMLFLDWRLAAILIVLGILTVRLNSIFAKTLRKISDELQKDIAKLTERLTDLLNGLAVIKMFRINNIITGKYSVQNEKVKDLSFARGKMNAVLESTNCFLSLIGSFGIKLLGAYIILGNSLDFGSIIAIVQLLNGVKAMFVQLGNFTAQIQSSLAGAKRIYELMDCKIEHLKNDVYEADNIQGMVEFRNVIFNYEKDKKILDGFSMQVGKGTVAAIVGPSGTGKSTIIKLIMGFYPTESGYISIDKKLIGKYKLEELRNKIAYVPQDAYLFDSTIEENIKYGNPMASKEDILAASKAAYAHDFIILQPKGYETLVGERAANLSGGQKQRIAIARALLKNAPVLLLDEATSALDSESEQMVQDALKILMKGRTTIIVAHRLSTISNADLIFYFDEGRVLEAGSHEELIRRNGAYKYLYENSIPKDNHEIRT